MQGHESLCGATQSLASCLIFFTCRMGTLEATVVPAFPNESLFWKGLEPGLLPSGSHLFRIVPVLHRRGPGERAMMPEGHESVMWGGSNEPAGGWHGMVAASLPSVPPAFSWDSWPLLGLPLSQSSLQRSGCWVLWVSSNICSSPHRCLTVGLRVWAPVLGSVISLLLL